ncbi:pyruvate, water dikinase regulatory protein [Acetilactobacillus jinshanensis]|uniref:Putative pyruvate, phosphate dikinase regulatory protein n=1 Tax=Acetilactobacillus jinshanensis TaxID=1720083 RepID=A0A4V1ALL1_9LACO|nr:pyruvate, water dikinase regulatory protein [Acetilactobacillus jinshanensis]QBP17979.1 kinase/pyrophosphorylase [Acetilactobacillus jinshanensis]URL60841.1 kinase/pyrophosphorylase [uncultured bacterium]
MSELNLFVISDSSGGTALRVAKTAISQFKDIKVNYQRFPFITTESLLNGILKLAIQKSAMIFYTLVSPKLNDMINDVAKCRHLYTFDCLHAPVTMISQKLNVKPVMKTGMIHQLNHNYFDRIAAMEFAVANDDGKDPQDLDKADIVILGVSRTSKTPLSLYLANKKLKVANVPIGPKTQLPKQIWNVDKNRIFGLTNSIKILQRIRSARTVAYGLGPNTPYSDPKQIKKELDYAIQLYRKIGCLIINVADKSIEETATIIMESLGIN